MSDYSGSWERLDDIVDFYYKPGEGRSPTELLDLLEAKLSADAYEKAFLVGKYERLLRASREYYAHHGGEVIGVNVAMRDALEDCDG